MSWHINHSNHLRMDLLVHWHIDHRDHWHVDLLRHWHLHELLNIVDLYLWLCDRLLDDGHHRHVTQQEPAPPVVHVLDQRNLNGLLDYSPPWHM